MIKLGDIKSNNDLFLFLLHSIHNRFPDNAILKGGMVLRLLGSSRQTLDLDYVFIPFSSKREIVQDIEDLFNEMIDLEFTLSINSKAIRINICYQKYRAQVEINVASSVRSDVISTANLKDMSNSTCAQIIKIMSLDVALAHKLAAWNERRLFRDLYDAYYFLDVQGVSVDHDVLFARLSNIQSRLPKLKKLKSMSYSQFLDDLELVVKQLTQHALEEELCGVLEAIELTGLSYKLKSCFSKFVAQERNENLLKG